MSDHSDETGLIRWGRGHVPHARIPTWILDAVPSRSIHLYALLSRYADDEGHAFPGKRTLAARLGVRSVSTVDAALGELRTAGAVSWEPRVRGDGGRSSNDYLLEWVAPADRVTPPDEPGGPPTDEPGGPRAGETRLPERRTTERVSSGDSPPTDRPTTVGRRPVSDGEYERAAHVLREFNAEAGTSYSSKDWISKIVSRIREHPELDAAGHAAIIRHAFGRPWWDGPASPSVVYGNAGLFERTKIGADLGETGGGRRGITPAGFAAAARAEEERLRADR